MHDEIPTENLATVHPELQFIVKKLLRKSPFERYDSAGAALEALSSTAIGSGRAMSIAPVAQLTSVAILPFVFLSEMEERQALSLGFADALITILGNLEAVSVAPTSAILKYTAGAQPAH